ncbi:gag-pol polyprotein [Tanacetum coccineum]
MDPNNPVDYDTYDHYDVYFQSDYDLYTRDYEAYEHFVALCEQEAGGSSSDPKRRRTYIPRERETAKQRLLEDYFGNDEFEPKYPEKKFRRRYRMSSTLFNKIVNNILSYDVEPIPEYFTYFKPRYDATDRLSIGHILKCTPAIRQLAYDSAPDAFDEYLQIDERTSRECLDNFTKCINVLYVEKFLRKHTAADFAKTYQLHEQKHGLPGMLRSIDSWFTFVKTFPVARDEKSLKFKRVQEAARKDIERAFGVLQDLDVSSTLLYYWLRGCEYIGNEARVLSQKGSGVGRGVEEKQVSMAEKSVEVSKHVNAMLGSNSATRTPNVVNAGLESFPTVFEAHGIHSPASTNEENMNDVGTKVGHTPADNTLGMSSYANVTGVLSRKDLNFRTLFTLVENKVDVVVPVESIRAISERTRALEGFGITGSIGQTSNANLDMGDDVNIKMLTMEQYLTLIQDNIRPGVVKHEIGDDVEFEINSNFMRELRHKLFKGPTLRWKNRLSARSITTWDLLEKAFIRQYCPPFKTAKKLEEIRIFKQEMDETLYHAWERYSDLLYRCPQHDLNSQQKVQIFYTGLDISTRIRLDFKGFIPLMTPAQALKSIQVMADHSHNWYDGATTNCKICEGAHLAKECPLKKGQGERVKAKEIGKKDMKEPVPRDLLVVQPYVPPTPFLGHLKK